MMHPKRILTIMEGREENVTMINGFASAAKQRGWGFCQLAGIDSDDIARFNFDNIPLDFVVFRELSNNNYHEVERVMYWLKAHHKICINADVSGHRRSTSDKHFQQGLFLLDPFLKPYALPTFEAKHKDNVLARIKNGNINYPFVLKARRGTAGENITLINNLEDLDQIKDFSDLLIEQYIKPECDYRVFVLGGVAVGVIHKVGDIDNPGNFQAWSGGRQKFFEKDPATIDRLSEIATRAAAASRLEYAGVDIIKEAGTGKFYLLETNIAAGWQNLIRSMPVNIPSLTIDWFEDIATGKTLPPHTAITNYLKPRLHYLPKQIQETVRKILTGVPNSTAPHQSVFSKYPHKYLCDAGYLFAQLQTAFDDIIQNPHHTVNYLSLAHEIEHLPFSWAGNFVGPEVGTLHDGAILSALYLFLLHKIQKM